jgi:short-subunit dehydrogenase
MKKLKGRNALITGASRGLGVHIAQALAREGVNLAMTARSVESLEENSANIRSMGSNAVSIPADLSLKEEIETLVDKTEKILGPVDILINNAGIEISDPYEEFSFHDIETMIQVNLTAPMLLTRIILPGMLDRGRGQIVNISSVAGKTGFPTQTPYAATKSGLVMFTRSLRIELAGKPVGASVICPGFVAGEGMYARMRESGGDAPWLLKPTTLEKVAKSVITAIRKDSSEVIVNPLPMRPFFAIGEIFTGMIPKIHRYIGSEEYSRKIYRGQDADDSSEN